MNSTQEKWFDRLREMAEQVVEDQSIDVKKIDPTDITKLINDIQVFQVELEIQNDELRTSLDELEKSRTRFSRLFDMAPAGYIILDESGIILDANQTMMDMLHKHRDDLMRKPFSRFIAPDDQGIFLARFTAFYKNPADKTMEIRLIKGRSAMFHARLAARFVPLETYPGKPDIDQFCLIVTDITESKQVEQQEKKIRRYLEIILQTTVDGFWVLDMRGILIDVNQAYCRMTGYKKEQLIGMSIGDLDNIESPEMTAERIERIVANGSEFFETWHRRRDGSIFPVEVSTTWLPIDGGRLVCFGRNISERKHAEARILHLQKAESLGRMAGAVAHHYNNLLTVVMGNLEMAMLDMPGDREQSESLTHAMEAARRASKLGTMMLAYLGQTNAPRKLLDLSLTCKGFLPALRADMPAHITLEADLQNTGPAVTANARQIQQILECLITNAREAMKDHPGAVCLSIRRVSSSEIATAHRYPMDFQPGKTDYACMEVTDIGAGIPENDIDKIFEPFYSTKFTGRGLGLPVALSAVKTHNGCMIVSTRPGKGSNVTVFLPVTDKTDQALPDKRSAGGQI